MTREVRILDAAADEAAGQSRGMRGTFAATTGVEGARSWSPIKMAPLWGDRNTGEYAMLLKLPAGFVAPIHAHTGDYYAMNLTGTWRHSFDRGEQKDMPTGSYVFQPGMGFHGDACLESEDCILFIHQHAKGDFIRKQ